MVRSSLRSTRHVPERTQDGWEIRPNPFRSPIYCAAKEIGIREMIGQIPKFPTPACRNNCNSLKPITALRRAGTSVFQRAAEILRIPTVYSRDLNALGL